MVSLRVHEKEVSVFSCNCSNLSGTDFTPIKEPFYLFFFLSFHIFVKKSECLTVIILPLNRIFIIICRIIREIGKNNKKEKNKNDIKSACPFTVLTRPLKSRESSLNLNMLHFDILKNEFISTGRPTRCKCSNGNCTLIVIEIALSSTMTHVISNLIYLSLGKTMLTFAKPHPSQPDHSLRKNKNIPPKF